MKLLHDIPKAQTQASTEEVVLERLFELSVQLAGTLDRGLQERGLTRARAEVIWRLGTRASKQQELGRALRCTPRNVTGLVDVLEASGMVVRRPHPADRRAVLVTLTRKGRNAAVKMRADQRKAARALLAGIGRNDLARFGAVLERVLGRLDQAGVDRAASDSGR